MLFSAASCYHLPDICIMTLGDCCRSHDDQWHEPQKCIGKLHRTFVRRLCA